MTKRAIRDYHVKPDESVQVNDLLLVLDAMKMEIKINAQICGVRQVHRSVTDNTRANHFSVVPYTMPNAADFPRSYTQSDARHHASATQDHAR